MDDDFFIMLNQESQDIIEIDYQRTVYGSINTTLAWVNTAGDRCSITQVLSYPQCQPRDAIDVITSNTEVTIPAENFQISGSLADFNISSSMGQQSQGLDMGCPTLSETIRINGEPQMQPSAMMHEHYMPFKTKLISKVSLGI